MSSPNDMRTGRTLGTSPENYFPETFFIIYLVLAAILRRCGFKDCILYSKHSKTVFNQEMFDTGVIFNLYSEYGVGKSLQPLMQELLTTIGLDPEKNKYNIFFKEIIRLTPQVVNIIRFHDPNIETEWMMNYAMMMEPEQDNIANERILRMANLLHDIPSSDELDDSSEPINDNSIEDMKEQYELSLEDDNISGEYFGINRSNMSRAPGELYNMVGHSNDEMTSKPEKNDEVVCYCLFCHEFRKYHTNFKGRDVTKMINDVLIRIAKN